MKNVPLPLVYPKVPYNVVVNGKRFECGTEDEAWAVIGRYPMGSIWTVRDEHGNIRREFVPF